MPGAKLVLNMEENSFSGLTCTEAENICDKAEYKEASLREKFRLRLHLFFCKNCKDYNRRNKGLSSLLKKADLKACSSQEKATFKKRLKEAGSERIEKP